MTTTDVLAFRVEDQREDAARALAQRHLGGAPVVDGGGRVVGRLSVVDAGGRAVGIVARGDLVRAMLADQDPAEASRPS